MECEHDNSEADMQSDSIHDSTQSNTITIPAAALARPTLFEDPDVWMQVASFLRVSSLGRLACTAARFSAVLRPELRRIFVKKMMCLQAAVRRRLKAPHTFYGVKHYFLPNPECGSACSSQCSEGEDDGEEGGGGSSMKRAALPGDT